MNNCLEHCGVLIDKCVTQNIGSDLLDLLHGNAQQQQLLPTITISGLNDNDYQNISDISYNLKNIDNICNINKVSIPPEILEHFNHIKCHCMMVSKVIYKIATPDQLTLYRRDFFRK